MVTEIPYQVQKSKLIEKIAEVIQTKKVPILADVRDESADDIRVVLEPRSKNVDPEVLMGMMFRNSELETRFSLNMNVLIDGRDAEGLLAQGGAARLPRPPPRGADLRRSQHRMDKIDHRLEVLEGFIIAFLNLDRVIDIIRYDDDPKAGLMYEDWSRPHQATIKRATDETDYVSPLAGIDVAALELREDPDAVARGVLAESAKGRRSRAGLRGAPRGSRMSRPRRSSTCGCGACAGSKRWN